MAAREMRVRGFNAKMLARWMKNMRQGGEGHGEVWAAPPILTSRQRWVIETFLFQCPHLKVGKQSKVLGLVSYNNYYYIFISFCNNNYFTTFYKGACFSSIHHFIVSPQVYGRLRLHINSTYLQMTHWTH